MLPETAGVVLIGTHPWTNSTFDRLMPRAVLPIADRPLVSYALSWLRQGGVRELAVCGNRETRLVQNQLLECLPPGARVSYHEDPMPRGAAGSVRDAVAASNANTFVVADGTAIPTMVDLADLLAQHRASGAAVTIVVHTGPRQDDNPGVQEPTGIYVFERRALDRVPERGFCDIKEKLIPELYRIGERIEIFETRHPVPRVFGLSTYLAAHDWTVEYFTRLTDAPEGFVRSGTALVHRTAIVSPDAMLVGPVIVGAGATIKSGAIVVGPSSIGRDAIVDSGAVVSRSALWQDCSVGDHAVADRCVVAAESVIEPRTQAIQAIMNTRRVRVNVVQEAPALDLSDLPMLEFGRRVGRLLIGADWSRSPAAR